MIDPAQHNPERARLVAFVSYGEKRVARAAVKRRAAEREMEESLDALEAATKRLFAWDVANPDPQGNLLMLVAA